jgi:hypothetical protein
VRKLTTQAQTASLRLFFVSPHHLPRVVYLIMHSVRMRSTEYNLEPGRSARIGYRAFATWRERCPWFAGTGPLKKSTSKGGREKNSKA